MTKNKATHFITKGRFETFTTELGARAFENRFTHLAKEDINWEEEHTYPLHGAIYGGHLDLALQLLEWGSPLSDETYRVSFHYLTKLIPYLPFRPELIAELEKESRQFNFHWALIHQDILTALSCLHLGVDINQRSMIAGGMEECCPIHFAVRKGNLTLIEMVTNYGADLNSLTLDGKTALRLLAENTSLTTSERKAAIRYLQKQGAYFVPELKGWKEWIFIYLGWPLDRAEKSAH